ncbi:hypothetical protein [Methyloceanibacter sp. wino2]|uniref:hypothetical protein n=1 Tax=Methyloceanibacter sp. wino2 TaxID=2170729 RepID=UPI00131ED212|nr:hypothetical protein [Methyloceanibacter sp. wino2]
MIALKSHLILGALFAALICATITVSPTKANAGPKFGGGILGVSGLDLGSGR